MKKLKKKSVVIVALNDSLKLVQKLPNLAWPCYICGREGPDDSLKSIHVTREDGHSYTAGCFRCSMYNATIKTKDSVESALAKLTHGSENVDKS